MHLAVSLLLLGGVAACTGGKGQPAPESGSVSASEGQAAASPQASTPDAASAPASSQSAAAPLAPPSASVQSSEDPATAELKQTITEVLSKVAAGNPEPTQILVTDALTGAGIPAASLEVSASLTPTGLDVDAVEAAAIQGKNCVVGQIRDSSVMVTVLPVLASGRCFVGSPL